jgi:hypothetical protein
VQNNVFSRRKPILGFSPEKSFLEKRSLSRKGFLFLFLQVFSVFSEKSFLFSPPLCILHSRGRSLRSPGLLKYNIYRPLRPMSAVCNGRGSLPAVFGRCKHIVSFLVCLPLGRPLGLVVYSAWASNPPRSGKPGDLIKSCPCAAVLLGRLPSNETPRVSSLGCALVAVRACLWVLLCCEHPITFLTSYLPYPTVIPSVRYTLGMFHTFLFIGRLISLMWLE